MDLIRRCLCALSFSSCHVEKELLVDSDIALLVDLHCSCMPLVYMCIVYVYVMCELFELVIRK